MARRQKRFRTGAQYTIIGPSKRARVKYLGRGRVNGGPVLFFRTLRRATRG